MNLINNNNFFGLDIGTTGLRIVKLSVGAKDKPRALETYSFMPLDAGLVVSDSRADMQKVAQLIKTLVDKTGLKTKNVAVGLSSLKVFTTVADMDRLNNDELAKSIRFQADSLIPTPINESKLDWQLIGDSPIDKTKIEVLISSISNEYVESRLDLLETIGLNVIAFEPDALALTRALIDWNSDTAQMILDMGNLSTDLVIVKSGVPRLVRSIPTGNDSIIKSAMQNLNIDDSQAKQFVSKFGLNQQKLEGQIFHAISGVVDSLLSEVEKSIKFFSTRYQQQVIDKIIVVGGAAILPEFPVYLANKFAINVEIGNAWRNVVVGVDRQNELAAISNQFAVAAGLAERT